MNPKNKKKSRPVMGQRKASKILELFSHIYSLFYNGKIPEDIDMVHRADEWIGTHPEDIAVLVNMREDYFVSDRELNALALALDL